MIKHLISENKTSFSLLLLFIVLPVTVSSISLFYLSQYETNILTFSISQWFLFFLVTTFTMALALTPTTFIALICGYFLGWYGLLGLIPSYLLASLIGFSLANFIDNGNFLHQLSQKPKLKPILNSLKSDEFKVIFFSRISPVLPFAMMNLFLSYMKVSVRNFITAGVIGMLPRTLLSVYMGTQAKDIINMIQGNEKMNGLQLATLFLFILSAYGLYKIFIKAINKTIGQN